MAAWRRDAKWKRRRVATLLERDGPACWLCTRPLSRNATKPGRRITLEHLVPRAAGGGDGLDNLVLCHAACNGHLKDRPAEKKRKIREKWHREADRVRRRATPGGDGGPRPGKQALESSGSLSGGNRAGGRRPGGPDPAAPPPPQPPRRPARAAASAARAARLRSRLASRSATASA